MTFPHVPPSPQLPIQPELVGRQAMIIVGALMFGLLNFAGIALFVGSNAKPNGPETLSYFALGSAAVMVALRFFIPGLVTAAATRRTEGQAADAYRQQLATVYQTKTIIGAALLEGAGFFNCVAYIVTGLLPNIAAVAVLLTIMAMTFPSQTQFESWADQIQRDTL